MNEPLKKVAEMAVGAFAWGFFCLLGAASSFGLLKGAGQLFN